MDDYPYATLGADGWFRCDGLHRPGFPTMLRDVLHCFGYTGLSAYRGRMYCQFGLGHCKVQVNILAHPTDPTMVAWFTTARGGGASLMTLWRGLPIGPSWSSVSATYRSLVTPPSPCFLFGMRAMRCGVSVGSPSVTPSFQPTMRVERSRHATPNT
jgi:hypothetical protein